ncbi:uncharacterized protein LOC129608419 [Condylostylus longicornis]|uniref:uncharacterized protein LOC129608419 n=1 Tax=Condylostylus longicornis TaxID=2530218 RepID=UPI00244E2F9C|nr:uncharacterized protein LOC129608419 [Condylostylus longicornis]
MFKMKLQNIFFIFILISIKTILANNDESDSTSDEDHSDLDDYNTRVSENRLAAQMFSALEHYKQEDPVGFPNAPIADPMDIPDIKKSLGMAVLNMKQVKAYGLSKFRVKHVNVDLNKLKAGVIVQLDNLNVLGRYTLSSFLSKAEGPFTVVLKNVIVSGNASLEVRLDGKLATEKTNIDITFSDMTMDFQNLGFLGAVFQSIINSAPNLVFDSMKPFMIKEADTKIRNEIDTNIEKSLGDYRFPNSISPLDMAIAEGRRKVRDMGYDPFDVTDYNRTVGIFSVKMSKTWITGVSSFYRVGDVVLKMDNNTVSTRVQVGTQAIKGASQWEISVGHGMITRIGHVHFTVQHIRVTLELSQPLDTRKRPIINDLQIDLGNIQVRCDGAGTFDYVMEFLVNVLPNILRYQIMDAIENPIKMRLQEKLNQIDVERAIKENLYKFEKMGGDFRFDFKF